MAEFVYEPCTPADYAAVAKIYVKAFRPGEVYPICFPTAESLVCEWSIERNKKLAKFPEQRCFVLKEAATGKVAAFIQWAMPHTLSAEEKTQRKREKEMEGEREDKGYPKGANHAACKAFFDAVGAKWEVHADYTDMYMVNLLATDPNYQRRGLARRLLGEVLALADTEGKRALIGATADGHPLYLKLGFEDVDLIDIDLRPFGGKSVTRQWVQIRQPKLVASAP